MRFRRHTNEFSVVLEVEDDLAQDILSIRYRLPASPYRDDHPHVTLINGVTTSKDISDSELLAFFKPIMESLLRPPKHAQILKVTNRRGGFYNKTSAIALKATPDLLNEHMKLVETLEQDGFRISRHGLSKFQPHATIRLGVPLPKDIRHECNQLFYSGRPVNFKDWRIYRLISKRGKRSFYEVKSK